MSFIYDSNALIDIIVMFYFILLWIIRIENLLFLYDIRFPMGIGLLFVSFICCSLRLSVSMSSSGKTSAFNDMIFLYISLSILLFFVYFFRCLFLSISSWIYLPFQRFNNNWTDVMSLAWMAKNCLFLWDCDLLLLRLIYRCT